MHLSVAFIHRSIEEIEKKIYLGKSDIYIFQDICISVLLESRNLASDVAYNSRLVIYPRDTRSNDNPYIVWSCVHWSAAPQLVKL